MENLQSQPDFFGEQVKQALDEIFALCGDACDALKVAHEHSAEWHKRTGEVLAYARVTSVLLMFIENHPAGAHESTRLLRRNSWN